MSQKCFRSVCVTCHKAQHVECRLGASVIGLINATAAAAAMTFLHVQCRQHMHHKDIHHIPGAPFIFAINPSFFFFFVPMKCHLHLNSSQKKNWSDPSAARHVFWCTPVANSNHPTASQERDPLRQWMKQRSVEEVEKGCIIISLKITRAVTRAAVNEKGAVGVRVLKEISRSRPQTFYFLSILYIVFIV